MNPALPKEGKNFGDIDCRTGRKSGMNPDLPKKNQLTISRKDGVRQKGRAG